MKIFTFPNLKLLLIGVLLLTVSGTIKAQTDPVVTRVAIDTSATSLNMDAVYNRPFLALKNVPVALGGYLEANSN